MKVHPFTQSLLLTAKDLQQFEQSDRLLIPRLLFDGFECAAGKITILSISNSLGQTIVGTVHGYHDEPDTIYIPFWMYYSMDVTVDLHCSIIEHCICSKMSIRPHHSNFIEIKEWNIELGKAFDNYTSLTEGSIIPLSIQGIIQKFTIVGLYPYTHKTCILKNGDVLDVNILKSLEEQKQESTLKYLYKKDNKPSNVISFSCIGYKLGGQPSPNNNTQRGLVLDAVKKRLYPKKVIQTSPTIHPEIVVTEGTTIETINKFFEAAAQLRKERTIRTNKIV